MRPAEVSGWKRKYLCGMLLTMMHLEAVFRERALLISWLFLFVQMKACLRALR